MVLSPRQSREEGVVPQQDTCMTPSASEQLEKDEDSNKQIIGL